MSRPRPAFIGDDMSEGWRRGRLRHSRAAVALSRLQSGAVVRDALATLMRSTHARD